MPPPAPVLAEALATALLVAIGCSIVIADFGTGSVVVRTLPSAAVRRALTGLLFGTTGALIAISPLGRVSGAHVNPVVTLAFWLRGRISAAVAVAYVAAQGAGAVAGGLALTVWGALGRSVAFAATAPGPGGVAPALLGEALATAALIGGLFVFLGHRRLRPFTPALFPPLYAFLVLVEAPLSGTSTNPARSLGPALVGHAMDAYWLYVVGPVAGTLAVLALWRLTPALAALELEVAKLYHFEHDPYGLFHADRRPGS
jgi:aquaporin Z